MIGQLGEDVDRIPGGLVVIDGISSLAAISDASRY
jgi:hypothetical protein